MRYILLFWALPMSALWGWYFLSANDISFGLLFLSRDVHDMVFFIYGQILGIAPEKLPLMLAEACLFDTAIIGALFAFRRRREIAAWARQAKARLSGEDRFRTRYQDMLEADPAPPAE